MEDGDEYDAYNIILDIEDIPYLTSPVATHAAAPEAVLHESAKQTIKPFIEDNNYSPTFLKSGSSDTYSDYDFSEFTEQDFALIDASLSSAVPPGPSRLSSDGTLGTPEVPDNLPTPGADGPAVTITAEESTQDGDDSVDSNKEAEDQGFREPLSPFDGYRGWNGTLSVTDLTGPIW